MSGFRYRFVLVEDSAPLPILYRRRHWRGAPRGPWATETTETPGAMTGDPMSAILEAFLVLGRRGAGESAWAAPLADNPLGFLLDSVGDAVFVREASGRLLYRNRAAQDLEPVERPPVPAETVRQGVRRYERRCLVVEHPAGRLVLEVLHALSPAP